MQPHEVQFEVEHLDAGQLRAAYFAEHVHREAETARDLAFNRLLDTVEPFTEGEMGKFAHIVDEYWHLWEHRKDSRWIWDELVRRAVTGQTKVHNFDYVDVLRWHVTHRKLTTAFYEPLFHVVSGRGDDGYGDLLDSLPLAG